MKKNETLAKLRNGIVSAARNYSRKLTGRAFLYVFGNEYIEVVFLPENFLHLTGVGTNMKAGAFYRAAKRGELSEHQISIDPRNSDLPKRKIPRLIRLHELTTREVAVLKDLRTATETYSIALSDLEISVGMYKHGKTYSPQTMRVRDKAFENSSGGEIVDFIFARQYGETKYTACTFQDPAKEIPATILPLLDPALADGSAPTTAPPAP